MLLDLPDGLMPVPQWEVRAAGTTGLDGAIGDAWEQTARLDRRYSVPLAHYFRSILTLLARKNHLDLANQSKYVLLGPIFGLL